MSSSISPFYRPGVFPALSNRLLSSASQTLRLAINQQIYIKTVYSNPLRVTGLPLTTTKGFTYLIAASWHPKRKRQTVNSISGGGHPWWKERMRAGKVDAGEDAFFYVGTNNGVALGVADGVGGWSQVYYICFIVPQKFYSTFFFFFIDVYVNLTINIKDGCRSSKFFLGING